MKIGIVLSNTPGYSETFFMSKIKGLQGSGHEVVLFVQANKVKFTECKVKQAYPIFSNNIIKQVAWFVIVLFKLIMHPRAVLKFIKLEKQQGIQLLQFFKKLYASAHILTERLDWLHFGFATMALGKENIAKAIDAKMAVSLRGFDINVYPLKYPNCFDLLWEGVDKVHTVSNDLIQKAFDLGLSKGIPFKKITPAIDLSLFNSIVLEKNQKNTIKIVTIARLHWVKGLNYSLMAMHLLKQKGIKFSYSIIGDGVAFEQLSYQINQLGLKGDVNLLGRKSPKEIREELSNSTIYLQYSVSEGFCNAVLEAQAMGLLCVVSNAGGLPENVLDKKTGWVVEKRNPKKLADKIFQVINLKQKEKKQIIEQEKIRVKQEFNIQKQQSEFMNFYS